MSVPAAEVPCEREGHCQVGVVADVHRGGRDEAVLRLCRAIAVRVQGALPGAVPEGVLAVDGATPAASERGVRSRCDGNDGRGGTPCGAQESSLARDEGALLQLACEEGRRSDGRGWGRVCLNAQKAKGGGEYEGGDGELHDTCWWDGEGRKRDGKVASEDMPNAWLCGC